MAYKRNIRLEFMVGLPGSGKSTLAKELELKNRSLRKVVNFDNSFELSNWDRANESDRARIIRNCFNDGLYNKRIETLILDGLFLTHEDIVRVLKATNKMFQNIEVIIHQFNEDRDTCIKNDGGRREVSSTNTILHADYELINKEKLEKMIVDAGCDNAHVTKIVKHKVVLKPGWERFFRGKVSIFEDGKMRSDKWCVGGTCGSCWGDRVSPVTPDKQPDFEELDELLMNVCPSITFLQYKKIMRSCVDFEENYESEYYGGGCTYKRYVCDMKKLYSTLEEFSCNLE